tara:strand:- start:12390 stop:13208 length:819 start_codon:yes stop_codon:yes gene_type:complete
MISGFFKDDEAQKSIESSDLFNVQTLLSEAVEYQPLIKLKASTKSEKRINVKAKTSGEVVKIGAIQGAYVERDTVLCSLGVVELNRTEVKAPFSGFIEQIVKPGNFLERGQVCATIIQLDPITFIAGVPEYDINKVRIGQNVYVELVTGQSIIGELTFVSKSASPDTRTFSVESQIKNPDGSVKDGLTAEISIEIDKVKAHKISPSILLLNDEGKLGIRIVDKGKYAEFEEIIILEDSEEGLWVTGIPDEAEIIIQGQGFVEDGQEVITNRL